MTHIDLLVIFPSNSDGLSVVVYLPSSLSFCPTGVDPGVEKHLHPGHCLGEDQPHVHHLDVGRLRKAPWDADEESGEDEEGGQIHRHNGLKMLKLMKYATLQWLRWYLKEELFKEVCCIDNGEDKNGRQVDCKDGIQDPAPENNHQLDSLVRVLVIDVV